MPKLLVIHGAGMNMRGKSQIEVFGKMLLPEYDEHIRRYAKELGYDVEIFHSNIEVRSSTSFTLPLMPAISLRRSLIRPATPPVIRRW